MTIMLPQILFLYFKSLLSSAQHPGLNCSASGTQELDNMAWNPDFGNYWLCDLRVFVPQFPHLSAGTSNSVDRLL